MPKMTIERSVVVVLALALVLGIAVLSFAEEPKTHWAQDAIERWSVLAPAMADPDEALTLGEVARMLRSLTGLEGGDTVAGAVLACADAGFLDAEMVGTTDPDVPVSREAYFTMLYRALRLPPAKDAAEEDAPVFADLDAVSPWAREAVDALTARGWLEGVTPGVLDPAGNVDRGSALTLLDRAVSVWISVDSAYAGVEGGLVVVSARDTIVTGTADSVLIAGGARDSAVTLEDLTVSGGVDVACSGAALLLTGESAMEYLHVGADASDTRIYIGGNADAGELRLDAADVFIAGERGDMPREEVSPDEMPEEAPDKPEEESTEETVEEAAEETEEEEEEKEAEEETLPAEPAEPDAPYDTVEAVGPGVVVDYATGDRPYQSYELNVSRAEEDAAYDVLVEITMEGLEPHLSRGAGYGWWSGFSVAAPAGATGVTAEYSHDGATYGTPISGAISEERYAHYFDALRWNEYYIRLQWSGAELPVEQFAPTIYKLDFTGVVPDLSSLTTLSSPFGKFGAADLTDLTVGAGHKDELYQSCDVALTHVRDGGGGYLELTVRAEGLEAHRTAAGTGYWVGFSVIAPDEAGSYRYSAYLNEETARDNFAKKAPVPRESFTTAAGIVQRTNAALENQRDYWAVLQWYADAAGRAPLTAPEVIHVVIDASLAEP